MFRSLLQERDAAKPFLAGNRVFSRAARLMALGRTVVTLLLRARLLLARLVRAGLLAMRLALTLALLLALSAPTM